MLKPVTYQDPGESKSLLSFSLIFKELKRCSSFLEEEQEEANQQNVRKKAHTQYIWTLKNFEEQ